MPMTMHTYFIPGTTGLPKGIVRDIGGHIVALKWTMKNIYNINQDDIWWSASDIGWIVGHYILFTDHYFMVVQQFYLKEACWNTGRGCFLENNFRLSSKIFIYRSYSYQSYKKGGPRRKIF